MPEHESYCFFMWIANCDVKKNLEWLSQCVLYLADNNHIKINIDDYENYTYDMYNIIDNNKNIEYVVPFNFEQLNLILTLK
jgi:hypothetical protein